MYKTSVGWLVAHVPPRSPIVWHLSRAEQSRAEQQRMSRLYTYAIKAGWQLDAKCGWQRTGIGSGLVSASRVHDGRMNDPWDDATRSRYSVGVVAVVLLAATLEVTGVASLLQCPCTGGSTGYSGLSGLTRDTWQEAPRIPGGNQSALRPGLQPVASECSARLGCCGAPARPCPPFCPPVREGTALLS